MSEEIKRLKRELRAYDAIFALQHKRMAEATNLWRQETGQTCSPDLGELLAWLILSLNEAKHDRDKYREDLDKINAECQRHGGITPMGSRWELIKSLAHDANTAMDGKR